MAGGVWLACNGARTRAALLGTPRAPQPAHPPTPLPPALPPPPCSAGSSSPACGRRAASCTTATPSSSCCRRCWSWATTSTRRAPPPPAFAPPCFILLSLRHAPPLALPPPAGDPYVPISPPPPQSPSLTRPPHPPHPQGTHRGAAAGFRLDTLLKLADVKGTDRKTSLLQFVAAQVGWLGGWAAWLTGRLLVGSLVGWLAQVGLGGRASLARSHRCVCASTPHTHTLPHPHPRTRAADG